MNKFTPSHVPRSRRPAVWRLGHAMLVERTPEGSWLYGRWDSAFGCWSIVGGRLLAITPDRPVLDRRGVWLEPVGTRDDNWYDSRAAIAAYFSLIPTPIRRLVAPLGGEQWAWLAAIWRDPSLARRLDDRTI